jgi:hypothetical protein
MGTALMLVAGIFSVGAFIIAVFSLIEVKAMQRSTHKMIMVDPSTKQFADLTPDAIKRMNNEQEYDNI